MDALLEADEPKEGDVMLDANTPYYFFKGDYRPICGHWFWDNNDGATTFCKKLGKTSGTVKQVRGEYDEDAFHIGRCNAGEELDKCTAGDNMRSMDKPSCKKGNKVSIEIECDDGNIIHILVCSFWQGVNHVKYFTKMPCSRFKMLDRGRSLST